MGLTNVHPLLAAPGDTNLRSTPIWRIKVSIREPFRIISVMPIFRTPSGIRTCPGLDSRACGIKVSSFKSAMLMGQEFQARLHLMTASLVFPQTPDPKIPVVVKKHFRLHLDARVGNHLASVSTQILRLHRRNRARS